jgi:hypothetical protein
MHSGNKQKFEKGEGSRTRTIQTKQHSRRVKEKGKEKKKRRTKRRKKLKDGEE